jgi:hypothetical protein
MTQRVKSRAASCFSDQALTSYGVICVYDDALPSPAYSPDMKSGLNRDNLEYIEIVERQCLKTLKRLQKQDGRDPEIYTACEAMSIPVI